MWRRKAKSDRDWEASPPRTRAREHANTPHTDSPQAAPEIGYDWAQLHSDSIDDFDEDFDLELNGALDGEFESASSFLSSYRIDFGKAENIGDLKLMSYNWYGEMLEETRKSISRLESYLELHSAVIQDVRDELDKWTAIERELKQSFRDFVDECNMLCRSYAHDETQLFNQLSAECSRLVSQLPVYNKRTEIHRCLENYRGFVLQAETGAGKSTAVPQFVFEFLRRKFLKDVQKSIVVIQPRQFAARSVCKHVRNFCQSFKLDFFPKLLNLPKDFEELSESSLCYTSEICFLNYARSSSGLNKFSAIILDEVHERTVFTDVILGYLRKLKETHRKDLHIAVMSASLDSQLLSSFLDLPVVNVLGRQFPVQVRKRLNPSRLDPFSLGHHAAHEAFDLFSHLFDEIGLQERWYSSHSDEFKRQKTCSLIERRLGNVLVFLPGRKACEVAFEELSRLCKNENILMKMNVDESGNLRPFGSMKSIVEQERLKLHPYLLQPACIHGGVRPEDQDSAIAQTPLPRVFKVIFSTNVSETAVTIPNVFVVIDYGLVNIVKFDCKRQCNVMIQSLISQSSHVQRKGRAGRVRSGLYYQCYDSSNLLLEHPPQIVRSSLELFFLKILSIGQDPFSLSLPNPPDSEAILSAREELLRLGAIDNYNALTSLGSFLSESPVGPAITMIGHDLVKGGFAFGPFIVAALSVGISLFFFGFEPQQKLISQKNRQEFCSLVEKTGMPDNPLCEILVLTSAFIDAYKHKFCGSYICRRSLNGKYCRTAKEIFVQFTNLMLKNFDIPAGIAPQKPEDLWSCLPLLKSLLLKYFPGRIAVLDDVEASMEGSKDLRLHYKNSLDGNFVIVDPLVPLRIPPISLHYRSMRIADTLSGTKRFVSEITDLSDFPGAQIPTSAWCVTSLLLKELPWDLLLRICMCWNELCKARVFLYSPHVLRTSSRAEFFCAEKLFQLRKLLEKEQALIFIHPKSLDLKYELQKYPRTEMLVVPQAQVLGILTDGLVLSDLVLFKEDYPESIYVPDDSPSVRMQSNYRHVVRLPRPNLDFSLFFKSEDSVLASKLQSLGCFTPAIKTQFSSQSFFLILRKYWRAYRSLIIHCEDYPSAQRARTVLESVEIESQNRDKKPLVHFAELRKDDNRLYGFNFIGSTCVPVQLIEYFLQNAEVKYSKVILRKHVGQREPEYQNQSLLEVLNAYVRENFPSTKMTVVHESKNEALISITLSAAEQEILEGTAHFSRIDFIPIFSTTRTITHNASLEGIELIKNRLKNLPKYCVAFDEFRKRVVLRAYCPNGLRRVEQAFLEALQCRSLPVDLTNMLFDLYPNDFESALMNIPRCCALHVDQERREISVISSTKEEHEACVSKLQETVGLLSLSLKKSLKVPLELCLVLKPIFLDRNSSWSDEKIPDVMSVDQEIIFLAQRKLEETKKIKCPYTVAVSLSLLQIEYRARIQEDFEILDKIFSELLEEFWKLHSSRFDQIADGEAKKCSTTEEKCKILCFYTCAFDSECPRVPYSLQKCKHCVCLDCLSQYLLSSFQSFLSGEISSLVCPFPDCCQRISLADILLFISSQQIQRLSQRALQRFLALNRKSVFPCPTPQCGRPLVRSPPDYFKELHSRVLVDRSPDITCVSCKAQICSVCCNEAHPFSICSDGNVISMVGRQRCPECLAIAEKIEGCNHVKCTLCEAHFCWVCGFSSRNSNDIYGHMRDEHKSFV